MAIFLKSSRADVRMRFAMVAAILSIQFRSGHAQVVLNPVGEVTVCSTPMFIPGTLSLTCTTQDFALWSTSGFDEGLDNQTRVPAVSMASSSLRVTTTDTNSLSNPSRITLSNLTHDDHGATVTCEGGSPTSQQSATLSVGPPICTVSLRASSATTNSVSVRWDTENCLGTEPTQYGFIWYLVGGTFDMPNYEAISSPLLFNVHEITGLSPNTQYVVVMYLMDRCGIGTTTTVLVETRSLTNDVFGESSTTFTGGGGERGVPSAALVPVVVILLGVIYTLGGILLVVCAKFKLCAAIKQTICKTPSATNPSAKAGGGDTHDGMTELPPPPSATTNIGVEEYEDMDQFSASEDVTIGTMGGRDHHSETRGLPPPPSASVNIGVEEYEDMDCASEDITIERVGGQVHVSEARGLPPPPPVPVRENPDLQYEPMNQNSGSERVTMIANPCYQTEDS